METIPFLDAREIEMKDVDLIADYWFQSSAAHLKSMGADINLLPNRKDFCKMLAHQIKSNYKDKKAYATIWLLNNEPVGHCNTNKIIFGEEAYMHLHLWNIENRQKGMGTTLVKKSLLYFFKNLQIKQLFCEPFALNHAPNNLLKTVGFTYLKEYITKPGNLNYIQPVKRWVLTKEDYLNII